MSKKQCTYMYACLGTQSKRENLSYGVISSVCSFTFLLASVATVLGELALNKQFSIFIST